MKQENSIEDWEVIYKGIEKSPQDHGEIKLITLRPDFSERKVMEEVDLDVKVGVVGDNWSTRPSSRTPDKSPHPDMQVTLMNSRVIDMLAEKKDDWKLAGDQFYVDLDMSETNLPAGTRLELGTAVIEVTKQPHTGCAKFLRRFGKGALSFVSTDEAKRERLRGVNCKVVIPGKVRVGQTVNKL